MLVMYIFINTDLKMGKGKIAGQTGHAVEAVVNSMILQNPKLYHEYASGFRAKVVLKAKQEDMEKWVHMCEKRYHEWIWCEPIYDAGLTQIAPNSFTALGFCAIEKEMAPNFIKEAKLL